MEQRFGRTAKGKRAGVAISAWRPWSPAVTGSWGSGRTPCHDAQIVGGHLDHVDKDQPGLVHPVDRVEIVLVADLGVLGAQAGVKAGIAFGCRLARAQEGAVDDKAAI